MSIRLGWMGIGRYLAKNVEPYRIYFPGKNVFIKMGQDPLQKLPEHVERLPFFTLEKNCWVESLVLAPMVFWNFQIFRLSWAQARQGGDIEYPMI